ncbi:MAG: hypothetical protein WC755_07910, partial [Candidatus Woesearchaeota archaeon]
AFRNERNLYKRKCDFSGKEIISVYPPTSKYKVYDQKIWWSDSWDAISFGREFDFNRSFFEQFSELLLDTPQINLQNRNNENSEYCNDTNDLKNSYLCFNSEYAENYYYVNTGGFNGKDCMDLLWCMECELCYECTKVFKGYHCFWCFNCNNISDCYFCENLIGCTNCFGSINLRHKEYYIYNEFVGKEKFIEFIKDFSFSTNNILEVKNNFEKLKLTVPYKNLKIENSENCLGDYILHSKNCIECFDVIQSENCKYVWDGLANNTYDSFNCGINSSFLYECVAVYRSNNIKFSHKCTQSSDLYYCDYCFYDECLFGCCGLKHKKYCILNKQYTKEEYFKLIPKIIEYMQKTEEFGEFFPKNLSTFGYNDTLAQYYFPLSKEKALRQGFIWNDFKSEKIESIKNIPANLLPKNIKDIPDDILNWAIICGQDQKSFKIIPQELNFYRKENIVVPHFCPDCRHYFRKSKMNPRKLWKRNCMKCNAEIQTTYSPERFEIIYCEACYLKNVY